MRTERSLRRRVAVTLALFGGVVSLVLAAGIYLVFHDLEQRLIDDTLAAELDDYVARRQRNPASLPERTATIIGYVIGTGGTLGPVPDAVRVLGDGRHQLVLDGRPYRAAVRTVGALRYAMLYDTTALQRRERWFLGFLAAGVLLVAVASAFAGHWLAARVIAPVTKLAHRVTGLVPESRPAPLADEFPWDEVRVLAADFDLYLGRLYQFIERERLFTGDVSHELRTPLSVLNGAADLLLDDPDIVGRNRERIERIARAGAEMLEITDALLALARENEPGTMRIADCDAAEVVEDVVARNRELYRGKPVTVETRIHARPALGVPRAVLAMVVDNLLRNALGFTEHGTVRVTLDDRSLTIEDSGPGLDDAESSRLFEPYARGRRSRGAGLGLSLVQRLCERQGWTVSVANREGGGTVARLQFGQRSTDRP